MSTEDINEVTQEERNKALMIWAATVFVPFVPGILAYWTQKGYIQDQALESFNWSITGWLLSLLAFILIFVGIGLVLLPIVVVVHCVFCLMAMKATLKGEKFRTPFSFRILK
jgi:uncharacterized Tic20 family protein|tara:strand:- start:288 stop:623 length:336 start_codon:yes stop_codon:yes gene_type:complete